jgi:hypothetical protein
VPYLYFWSAFGLYFERTNVRMRKRSSRRRYFEDGSGEPR